jgi:hypothetical protein
MDGIEFMSFPRLPGIAELGWSPVSRTNWQKYEHRLASQGPRWDTLGINYYRSSQVPWVAQQAIVVDDIVADSVLFGGKAEEVGVTVANRSNQATTITVSLDTPKGWEASTSTKQVSAKDLATIGVEVVPPSLLERANAKLTAMIDAPSNYDVFGSAAQDVDVLPAGVTEPYDTAEFNEPIDGQANFIFSQFGQSDEKYGIYGGGYDLWETTDEFGTIYLDERFDDSASTTVKVTSQDRVTEWTRAGIVVRNDLTRNGSAGYLNLAVTPDHGCTLTWDSNGDGRLDSATSDEGFSPPVYVRLTRSGRNYTAECSNDTTSWTQIGTVSMESAAPIQDIGMFMSAVHGGSGTQGLATFEEFSVTNHDDPTDDTNVALASNGAEVSATSVESGTSFTADKAIDANLSTRWSSARTDDEWLEVELAEPQRIGKAVLVWQKAYGEAYEIQVSTTGTSWQTVTTVSDSNGGTDELRFDTDNQVRFVRMQGINRATEYGYCTCLA